MIVNQFNFCSDPLENTAIKWKTRSDFQEKRGKNVQKKRRKIN